jgi:hypothetical protein
MSALNVFAISADDRMSVPSAPGARGTAPTRRGVGKTIFLATMLPLLVASLAATGWSFWILASGALGRQAAGLAVAGIIGGAAALAKHTGRGFAASLIVVGFAAMGLLIAALFGVAGYRLIVGG